MTTADTQNPLFAVGHLPRFEEITPETIREAVPALLEQAREAFAAYEASIEPTFEGIFDARRDALAPLGYAWGITGHLMGVKNSDDLRAVYEELQPAVVELYTAIGQSEPVFTALEALRGSEAWDSLDPARQRLVEKEIVDAKLSGIGLEGEAKERFNAIQKELAELSTGFSNAALDSRKAFELVLTDKADVEGLPGTLLHMAAASAASNGHEGASPEDGPWRITLDYPVMGPFLQHSRNRAQREQVYRAMIAVASEGEFDNRERIERILTLRRERAGLLGYRTHAEISVATKMAQTVEAVDQLTEELRAAAYPKAQEEHAELEAYAQAKLDEADYTMRHWDAPFWSERMREERYELSDEDLRPYFPFEQVLGGLFGVTKKLFGVEVRAADGETQVWHPDVRFFRIFGADGGEIASFYLDPYSRPENKRAGAWMNDVIGRERRADGSLQLPTAVLVCNQTPPAGDRPSLMSHREVETLFHEFGHGLQHMLTQVELPDAAGINSVEWDAVELPSQFMENWTYHEETVKGFARHYETGEALPSVLFERLVAAKNYRAGSACLRQLYFGSLDMELHHRYEPGGAEKVADAKQRVADHMTVVSPLPEDHFECSFGHIFAGGYAAGYYSYKWAEVLSADAFGAFEEAGLTDAAALEATGARFRDTVLALGGSKHPMEVFRDFRGREPSSEALLRHTGLAS